MRSAAIVILIKSINEQNARGSTLFRSTNVIHYVKKTFVSILLMMASCMVLFGNEPQVQHVADNLEVTPAQRQMVWEAEWPNRLTGTFELLPTEGCSGGAALWAREGTGRLNEGKAPHIKDNPYLDMGVVDYYFAVPADGRYQVYMRLWAMDKCGNSCWLAIDSYSTTKMTYFPGGDTGRLGDANYLRWPKELLQRWIWATDETAHYFLKKGRHHMRILAREDGFGIDQVALLTYNSTIPDSKLKATQIPGRTGLPVGTTFSAAEASTTINQKPTPFDLFVALDDPVASGTPLQAAGTAWVRLNSNKETTITLNLIPEAGTPNPVQPIRCTLTADAPVLKIPISITLPATAERRNYTVKLSGQSADWPGLIVERELIYARALDWLVSSPMSESDAARLLQKLARTPAATKTKLPTRMGWSKIQWTRIEPGKHYNNFGAVDLAKVYGPITNQSVVVATWITVNEPGPAAIHGGGDDTIRLYSGNRPIMSDLRKRPLTDTISLHPVRMSKGKQLLLGLVTQGERWWQYHVDFRKADGEPNHSIIGHPWND